MRLAFLDLFLILVVPSIALAYPVFGTKRYGRSNSPQWTPMPIWRSVPMPARYYEHPYPPYQLDDYYYIHPSESLRRRRYPLYSHPDVYQSMVPYYYAERQPQPQPHYRYYGNDELPDPVEGLQEEILQEEEREEREEALPIGQETWFENSEPRQDSIADINAAFLQNLIAQNMYNDALSNKAGEQHQQQYYQKPVYDDYADTPSGEWYPERSQRDFEDEDVKELKSLAGKPISHVPKTHPQLMQSDYDRYQDSYIDDNDDAWINWGNKRSVNAVNNEGSVNTLTTSNPITTDAPSTENPIKYLHGGQKEMVQPRPATPVRHPFSEPIMEMLGLEEADHGKVIHEQKYSKKKRTPSVYDTIKQLLAMERDLDKDLNNKAQPRVQKRFISSEENLVKELNSLKQISA